MSSKRHIFGSHFVKKKKKITGEIWPLYFPNTQSCFVCWVYGILFAERSSWILKEQLTLFIFLAFFPWFLATFPFHQKTPAVLLGDIIEFFMLKWGPCSPSVPFHLTVSEEVIFLLLNRETFFLLWHDIFQSSSYIISISRFQG